MLDFSIIICTYNPDIRVIKRCLKAIQKMESSGVCYETILVDNNSTTPIKKNLEISELLKGFTNLKIISEFTPGLSNARITGVQNAIGSWIVFFDDDNEANPDYLIQLSPIVKKYPNVGIWGPGQIVVDFIDKTTEWIEKNCRETFQEKKFMQTEYALQQIWNRCYPPGSGFCIRKDIFLKYRELYYLKKFTTTGVTGKSLIGAAEDVQIVYTSIIMGLAVGVCPELKLTHIISARKSNFMYVKKIRFFNRYSVPTAEVEIFPEKLDNYRNKQYFQIILATQIIKYLIKGFLKGEVKNAFINCILICGNYAGNNVVLKKKNPYWLIYFLKILGIKLA